MDQLQKLSIVFQIAEYSTKYIPNIFEEFVLDKSNITFDMSSVDSKLFDSRKENSFNYPKFSYTRKKANPNQENISKMVDSLINDKEDIGVIENDGGKARYFGRIQVQDISKLSDDSNAQFFEDFLKMGDKKKFSMTGDNSSNFSKFTDGKKGTISSPNS